MDPETPQRVADVLGILAIAGVVGAAALSIALVLPGVRPKVVAVVGGSGTTLAAGIAAIATAGSLWFSEAAGFPPCELCWYQRIAMYPLVVVLPVAAWRKEWSARVITFVLAGIGLGINVWHNAVQTDPSLSGGSCDPNNPCTLRWVDGLGFWTIPRLAGVCFALILLLTVIDHLAETGEAP